MLMKALPSSQRALPEASRATLLMTQVLSAPLGMGSGGP